MKSVTSQLFDTYSQRHSFLHMIQSDIFTSVQTICDCFYNGGKLLVCGNGGSSSDADHIAGELLKGLLRKRFLTNEQKVLLWKYGADGETLADKLQGALPVVNLCAHTSLITAVINDIGGDMIFAQQLMGYGKCGDVLLGISTSGNSKNVLNATMVANAFGLKTIAITGSGGGLMSTVCDISIKAPTDVSNDIQSMHSVVYHVLCTMIESEFWGCLGISC